MKLHAILFGYRRLSVDEKDGATLLNICMKYGFGYYKMGVEDGKLYLVCPLHTAARIKVRCDEYSVECSLGEVRGIPAAARYKTRGGLIIGGILAVLMLMYSGNFVWDIRVRPMDGIDALAIESALADCGFVRGTDLRSFVADETENLFLRTEPGVSWISINVKGTVAYVEATPKMTAEKDEGTKSPANVVADCDGVIVEMITYNGLRVVEIGDAVHEGELLISGAYGEKTPGLHLTRASGRIMAKTFRTVSVEIPLEYEEKVETGRTFQKKYLIFFGNSIKLFGNSGNLGSTCDTIIEDRVLGFAGAALPVVLRTETETEYTTVLRYRSEPEAKALAIAELEKRISDMLSGSEILKRESTVTFDGRICRIECRMTCIEEIGRTVEFSAELTN